MSRPPASPGSPGPDQQESAAAPAPDVAEHELWTAAMSSEPASPDREGVATAAEFTAEFAEHATPPAWAQEGAAAEEGSDTAEALGPLSPERLRSVLESLLFAAERPLTVQRIVELLEETAAAPREPSGPPLYQAAQIKDVLTELGRELQAGGRGIELHEVAGGWQLRTAAQNAPWVQRLLQAKPVRLSRAQLETMAIVAYRQPVTRPEIDDIRGVDSGGALKTLLDRQMVRVLGKKEEPGRPLLYGTTREFLEFFNLRDLKDLPTLREYHDLTDENREKMRALGHEPPLPGMPTGAADVLLQTPGAAGAAVAQQAAAGAASVPAAADLEGAAALGSEPGTPAAEPGELAAAAPGATFTSRRELIDQQLADDAEQLAKIDEMIRAVNTAFPLLDPTLLGMVADGTLPPPPAPSPAGPFAVGELDELNPEEDSPASAATSMGSDDREPEEL
jgi:segregation and condensation protein B